MMIQEIGMTMQGIDTIMLEVAMTEETGEMITRNIISGKIIDSITDGVSILIGEGQIPETADGGTGIPGQDQGLVLAKIIVCNIGIEEVLLGSLGITETAECRKQEDLVRDPESIRQIHTGDHRNCRKPNIVQRVALALALIRHLLIQNHRRNNVSQVPRQLPPLPHPPPNQNRHRTAMPKRKRKTKRKSQKTRRRSQRNIKIPALTIRLMRREKRRKNLRNRSGQ